MRRSPGISVEEAPELDVQRMRRRHLRGVMAIERQVYPRPWSPNLFLSEMSDLRNRTYLVARIGKEVVGYGGVMSYGDEAHVTTIAESLKLLLLNQLHAIEGAGFAVTVGSLASFQPLHPPSSAAVFLIP